MKRKLRSVLVIGSESVDPKTIRIDSGGAKLYPSAGRNVAREKSEHHVLAFFERLEKLEDAIERMHVELAALHAFLEPDHVEVDEFLHPLVDVLIRVSGKTHRVSHDLLVGFPVVPVRRVTRSTEHSRQCALHCGASETFGAE